MANHFRTDEQQESSFDDRFGVISQDDLNQLDQQDVVADQVETQDFSADVPVAQAAETVTTVSDPFASGAEAVHVVTAEQQNNPEQAPLDRAKFFADLAQDAPQVERTGTPTISFKGASLVYPSQPNRPALDNISADIYPGEFVFVVGHSGSGKSSLLRLITREQKATHGQVIVAGQDLTRMRNSKVPYLRRQIGTVFQDFKLLPDKTVYENVSFALECIGKPRSVIKVQVPEVLRLVGLGQKMDAYPDQLSGGEQQRVSVARAMVNRPPLLICDEPTGNLDPAISLGIMKLLDRINRAGTTVVMATHDREMVDSMRKRVIALEAGHIVRDQEKGGYGYYGAL
ncbi:MAG: cell division ATP-binding protein FtsE [Atopobium sp.]|uniref:Cell division ATP-binding protein FtsE n=1 Tax=Lancefieldella parvula TaxID=1382 RepID=A0A9D5X4L0_9ACTN|nr:cell division ATP-binding protein FtsE [Atopobium sp.]MBF0915237.1 cell division ATP-binding protein FtsE [Atopobium sp.]MBF0920951.1 cell division ATP-binding protein FtsE [Atopobium sp.]MBF4803400.1 cell division ATP-binding protein FtsE [Lancefieldella parvula]